MGLGYEGPLWRFLISAAIAVAVAMVVAAIRNPKSPAAVGIAVGAGAWALDWYTEKNKA